MFLNENNNKNNRNNFVNIDFYIIVQTRNGFWYLQIDAIVLFHDY